MGGSLTNVPFGVYPLFGIMAVAVGGCSYFVWHKSTGPDCVWARGKNPEPWNTVQPHQTSKLYDVVGKSEKWSRWSVPVSSANAPQH
ncbi:uncharacterized protein EV422DRAFT_545413 [Fimicolochytrium jonesii]|uniref:uncharacterized protein n=1 Tax=Fimicolochytrium jonesii TaxID=1396493 RepID=UPI0022FDDEEA|nr:uncharacterized protein EV422DRAFT_545413 [Fimicolochytrium jonesii]KAI8816485.1 hypothetical protein EV422DRAFT_545413 [Fimicolochytrium jonesii]